MGELLLEIDEREIIEENSPIDINIINNTEDDLIYKILIGKDGIWETLREFGAGSRFIWIPNEVGNYMIMVQGKREDSKKPFDYKVTQSIIVNKKSEKTLDKII